jgi:hypothetical protein
MLETLVMILMGYLWGSLSPTHFVARWRKGIDLRAYGSGNVGGMNLGVLLGKQWAVAIGALDWAKGLLPALVARLAGADWTSVVLISLATVLGSRLVALSRFQRWARRCRDDWAFVRVGFAPRALVPGNHCHRLDCQPRRAELFDRADASRTSGVARCRADGNRVGECGVTRHHPHQTSGGESSAVAA